MEWSLLTIFVLVGLTAVIQGLPVPNESSDYFGGKTPSQSGYREDVETLNKIEAKDLTKELQDRKILLQHLLEDTNKQLESLKETPEGMDNSGDDNNLQRESRFVVGQPIMPGRGRLKKKGKRILENTQDVFSDRDRLEKLLVALESKDSVTTGKADETVVHEKQTEPECDSLSENCDGVGLKDNTAILESLSEKLSQRNDGLSNRDLDSDLRAQLNKIQMLLSRIRTKLNVI